MSIVKRILDNSGSGKEFESVTTSEVTYDLIPEVGSFNPVVSDGIAKALEVATEIPVVSADTNGKVLTASWDSETGTGSTSWEDSQGAEYTAGDGIAISDSNVISCTVQGPTAGDGIAVTGNTVSVYHDSTLTGVGGTQYTDIVPDVGTAKVYANEGPGGSFAGWEYSGVAFEADATGDIRFALRPYDALLFNGEMFDEPNVKNKQVAAILVNPSDSTKWAVTQVYANNDIVYTDNGGYLGNWDNANPKVFDVGTSSRGNWMLHSVNVDEFSDLVSNGKVLVYLTVSASTDSFTPMYGSNDWYYYGPAYQGGKLYTTILATGNGGTGTDPVPPTTWNWRTTEGALQVVTGSGVAQLSVANPVPSVDGQTGKFLKAGSSGPEWVEGGVPHYTETTSAYVGISYDNEVVTSTADVTAINVAANVKSAVVQWVVNSTTTLPTVVDSSNNPLKASVNNPASLTVGRTVQVSILNGTWVCAEFA